MSGLLFPLLPKTNITFDRISVGDQQLIVLVDRINLIHWREATMQVNVHSHTLTGPSDSITIGLRNQSVSEDDPAISFTDRDGSFLVGLAVTSFDVPPRYIPLYLTGPGVYQLGPMAQLVALGSRQSSGSVSALVSVDLSLKDV